MNEKNTCSGSSESDEKTRISKCVTFVFGVLPILVMIGIFLLFSFNDSLKLRVVDAFRHLQSSGVNLTIACNLILYGALLVFVSFPYVIFEMSLGFTFPPMEAIFFAVTAKFVGEVMCFCLSRYLLKSCFLKFLRLNEHFVVIEAAVKKYPWTVSNLLRASILVPLFVINFGAGIVDLTFMQYIVPALLWGALYSAFSVLCGSQLGNISDVIENAAFPKNPLLFAFELSMFVLSLVIIIAAIWKSSQIYDSIKAEILEEEIEKTTQIVYSTNNRSSSLIDSEIEEQIDTSFTRVLAKCSSDKNLRPQINSRSFSQNTSPKHTSAAVAAQEQEEHRIVQNKSIYISRLGTANI